MIAYTYTTLATDLRSYLANEDEPKFTASQDRIIGLGESRVAREVDTPDQKSTVGAAIAANGGILSAPVDFVSPLSLTITPASGGAQLPALLLKDVGFLREAYGVGVLTGGGTPGVPRFYAIADSEFGSASFPTNVTKLIIAPVADVNYNYSLYYRRVPDSIASVFAKANTTYSTWLATYHPQALLYACLTEGYTYLKGADNMIAQYEKLFVSAVAELRMAMAEQRNDQFRKAS